MGWDEHIRHTVIASPLAWWEARNKQGERGRAEKSTEQVRRCIHCLTFAEQVRRLHLRAAAPYGVRTPVRLVSLLPTG